MIDHLLFNKLNWFNNQNYNIIPNKIKVPAHTDLGTAFDGLDTSEREDGIGAESTEQDYTFDVFGAVYFSDATHYYIGNHKLKTEAHPQGDTEKNYCWIIDSGKTKVIPIWGGRKDLLAHVYQAITSLFRRAVIA